MNNISNKKVDGGTNTSQNNSRYQQNSANYERVGFQQEASYRSNNLRNSNN